MSDPHFGHSSPEGPGRAGAAVSDGCRLRVNGGTQTLAAHPGMTLLQALREGLHLHGPKHGCGEGGCGACTVLVDGRAQTSCNLPLWAVQDREVVTLEGLGTPEHPHPLQRAFLEEQAAQCGYCTAGMITAAAALLACNPDPDRAAIVQALEPQLCRCGAHGRIVRAVQRAARLMRGEV